MTRLKQKYEEALPSLMKELKLGNKMAVPRLEKVIISVGTGSLKDKKKFATIIDRLTKITGQKPKQTAAKQSIATFKLRQGDVSGVMVTLRGARMNDFLNRLLNVAIPRIRDFRGLPSRSFDGSGNYSLGIKEQIIFPEIDFDKVDAIRGMDITIVTTAKTDEECRALLVAFKLPLRS